MHVNLLYFSIAHNLEKHKIWMVMYSTPSAIQASECRPVAITPM